MERCVSYVKSISDIYESMYVDRCLVICKSSSTMYHTQQMLERLDFPVEIVTIFNSKEPLHHFVNGTTRMLIMSEAYAILLKQYVSNIYHLVNVVVNLDGSHASDVVLGKDQAKEIFFFK